MKICSRGGASARRLGVASMVAKGASRRRRCNLRRRRRLRPLLRHPHSIVLLALRTGLLDGLLPRRCGAASMPAKAAPTLHPALRRLCHLRICHPLRRRHPRRPPHRHRHLLQPPAPCRLQSRSTAQRASKIGSQAGLWPRRLGAANAMARRVRPRHLRPSTIALLALIIGEQGGLWARRIGAATRSAKVVLQLLQRLHLFRAQLEPPSPELRGRFRQSAGWLVGAQEELVLPTAAQSVGSSPQSRGPLKPRA